MSSEDKEGKKVFFIDPKGKASDHIEEQPAEAGGCKVLTTARQVSGFVQAALDSGRRDAAVEEFFKRMDSLVMPEAVRTTLQGLKNVYEKFMRRMEGKQ